MHLTWNDLTVNFDDYRADDLLSDWYWLFPHPMHLFLISAIGDMFLQAHHDDAGIYWLNVGTGELTYIADSIAEFKVAIAKPENLNLWFIPQLIGNLKLSGLYLDKGQCYSYKVPPFLNGSVEVSNFAPCSLSVHFCLLGQLYKQIKDLPDGTVITKISVNDATVKSDT
ncbi:DUF1851 domain-containing protein [Nostoc sp. LEGE 06077]|uniref:T6SS immunity protein Tdi1 domain-containing protein n=1 Tax=Nostoc sp. LEGE 06077 TaxID=915325 RepID=UPI0018820ACA|nr:T6SS immunity protein Tdi1 domain-containing protein [Nostoc sp. LEGE 06077]MBE9210688.1 DUF1851 domain-containing protein [Nostoc sp. LEGE 06077]